AVTAHAVVAPVDGRATYHADGALRVATARDPELDLHDVSWVAPHHRVVGVVHEVVQHRHEDHAGVILLAHHPRDRVGCEVDVSVALGEAGPGDVGARMKAPGGDP